MNIRKAVKEDIEELINIWNICFGDDSDYIKEFYRTFDNDISTIIVEEMNKVIGMINLISATYISNNVEQKAMYLYAIGVLPEYRGKGYFKELIESVHTFAESNDMILFLQPDNIKLMNYYKEFNYSEGLNEYVCHIKKSNYNKNIYAYEFREAKIDESILLLSNSKKYKNYIQITRKHYEFAIKEILKENGLFLFLRFNGKDGIIIAQIKDNNIFIKYTSFNINEIQEAYKVICDETKCTDIYISTTHSEMKEYTGSLLDDINCNERLYYAKHKIADIENTFFAFELR